LKVDNYVIDINEAAPDGGYYKDNWYVVLPNDFHKRIFRNSVKDTGNLPWKKQIVKIYSPETKKGIHRIYKGAFRVTSKTEDGFPIIRMSPAAARVLISGKINSNPMDLQLSKGSRFLFYWNHFDASVRCSYKLGFVALIVSLVGLIISVISIFLALV
jgi:hypothetical protein